MPGLRFRWTIAAGLGLLLLAAGIGRITLTDSATHGAQRTLPPNPTRLEAKGEEHARRGGEAGVGGPAQARYDDMAFPRKNIAYAQVKADHAAFERIPGAHGIGLDRGRTTASTAASSWEELGPVNPTVPAPATYTNRATNVSGRVAAMAIAPTCVAGNCVLYVGAAGGGIWKTTDALATTPAWTNSWNGPISNAIGSIAIDPHNPNVIYVGTGEPSGSSDSEAGVGLYKSTNAGASWSLVSSSVAISKDRAIGTIAIDPSNSNHILIGTDVARHGDSSVNGGRFTPPGAPKLALYETLNGGTSWTNVLQLPQDRVDPSSANGNDFFAGGITKILFDPNSPATVYASSFTSGLWRRIGGAGTRTFQQIFHAQDIGGPPKACSTLLGCDTFERTEFALAAMPGGKTRIWAGSGDATTYDPAKLWRVDDSSLPSAALLATEDHPTPASPTSWQLLSAGTVTDPNNELREPTTNSQGFTSFNFCQDQCSYDMGVWSPPGQPGTVVLQGSMAYPDLFGGPPYSNGMAVLRSTDAGLSFSDMTVDALSPPNGLHPDQRALAFDPANPNIFWVGSDGGVVRVGGSYTDASSDCDSRDFSGSASPANAKAACKVLLKAIPTQLDAINDGLPTLQFQSVTINQKNPSDLIGGTQDNGTWAFDCSGGLPCTTFETINGDGGQSAIDATNPSIRTHSYYGPQFDTNFNTNNPTGWDWISDPLLAVCSPGCENFSFYPPFIQDPVTHGYEYTGGSYVYRTKDDGGPKAFLDQYCNEFTGDYRHRPSPCGDWKAISGNLVSAGSGKDGGYVAAIERAPSDKGTMWVGTRRGRIFVTTNAQAAVNSVTFHRIDTASQPRRFPSGISIDPQNPDHAFISFSGYNAYTPTTPGHVFEVFYKPKTHKSQWKDLSGNLGDQPINDVELVSGLHSLYAATDFGVLKLRLGTSTWTQAAGGLPQGAVFGLRQVPGQGVLFAATHGRGVWRLSVPAPKHKLRVKRKGKGTVKSKPAGIKCGHKCSASYTAYTRVLLKATPKKHWRFVHWSGACHGKKKKCHVTMTKSKKVRALFKKVHRKHR